jgi:hypothetical protein
MAIRLCACMCIVRQCTISYVTFHVLYAICTYYLSIITHLLLPLLIFITVSLQYEHRTVHGRKPSPRGYHVAFLQDSRLFAIGGFNGQDVFDEVHVMELAGASYLPQVTSFEVDVEGAVAEAEGARGG